MTHAKYTKMKPIDTNVESNITDKNHKTKKTSLIDEIITIILGIYGWFLLLLIFFSPIKEFVSDKGVITKITGCNNVVCDVLSHADMVDYKFTSDTPMNDYYFSNLFLLIDNCHKSNNSRLTTTCYVNYKYCIPVTKYNSRDFPVKAMQCFLHPVSTNYKHLEEIAKINRNIYYKKNNPQQSQGSKYEKYPLYNFLWGTSKRSIISTIILLLSLPYTLFFMFVSINNIISRCIKKKNNQNLYITEEFGV